MEANGRNLMQRLSGIMKDVKAVNKEDKKVNNQYKFVSHDAVVRVLHDPLVKHGVMMIPDVVELKQDGNRTIAMVHVKFVNIDDPKDMIVTTYWGYGIDSQDKGVGKAISYAVKYCLLKTFCLETGDDVERDNMDYKADASKGAQKDMEPQGKLSEEQLQVIYTYHDRLIDKVMARLRKSFGYKKLEDVSAEYFDDIIKTLEQYREEQDVTGK